MESEERKDVHTEHCCQRHGCMYGDRKCTVIRRGPNGEKIYDKQQSFMCEVCIDVIWNVEYEIACELNEMYDLGSANGWKRGFAAAKIVADYMGWNDD